jgi:serine/threonine protein phosphatase 1
VPAFTDGLQRPGHSEQTPVCCKATVTKISRFRRCLRLAKNAQGRDFVVGDLHGHRSLFERELERLGFDPRRDRVLSVGDLIDRGPNSLATLSLIEEPWFFAALGNHELMLLNFLGYYTSRLHARKSFSTGGGEWVNDALSRNRKALLRLADRVASLPLAIHVEGESPFNVLHGDLAPIGAKQGSLFVDATICVHKADAVTSSRGNITAALKSDLLDLSFAQRSVRISPSPLGELPITYVGHSPTRHVTVHNSYVHIDQGVCARTSKASAQMPPTVLDHRKFAYWLSGVATACGRAAMASGRSPEERGVSPDSTVLA